jgi:hypothetical protein
MRQAEEIERVRKEQQPTGSEPQLQGNEPQAKPPEYGKWAATTICSDPDKKGSSEKYLSGPMEAEKSEDQVTLVTQTIGLPQ